MQSPVRSPQIDVGRVTMPTLSVTVDDALEARIAEAVAACRLEPYSLDR